MVTGRAEPVEPRAMSPRELADHVLRVSNLGTVDITRDHKGALIGFLARCRTLLHTLTTMVDSGTDDAGDALTRSIYEHTATALWMLADPEANYRWLRQAYVSDWKKIRDDHRRLFPGEPFLPEADVDWLLKEEPGPRPLPSVPKRAEAAGLEAYYVAYRIFCLSIHGTLAASALGLNRRPELNIRDERLGLSSRMVLLLTEATRRELGMSDAPEIGRLLSALLEHAIRRHAERGQAMKRSDPQ